MMRQKIAEWLVYVAMVSIRGAKILLKHPHAN